jgi:tetratricopeptide (TPR) repeat protein
MAIALNPQYGDAYAWRALLHVQWRGDLTRAQAILDEVGQIAGITDDTDYLAEMTVRLGLLRRDFNGVLGQLRGETPSAIANQFYFLPLSLERGQTERLLGRRNLAGRSFESARLELEQAVTDDPDDARFHSALGIAYAGLGRHDDAVREAKLGCDLMPASKDAWRALYRLEDLALVYTMVGQHSEAIERLDDLLAPCGWFTAHMIRLDPRWDPLRADPRFQALLTKYEVKD